MALGALAVTTGAQTGQTLVERSTMFERIIASGAGGELTLVGAPHGNVRVTAWRGQTISLVARVKYSAPSEKDLDTLGSIIGMVVEEAGPIVDVHTSGPHDKDTLKSVKKFPKALTKMPWRVDYEVRVPEYTSVQIGAIDGDVEVTGVYGAVAITSIRGAVAVRNVGGFTKVTAGDGNVTLATIDKTWRGAGTDVVTARGDVVLEAPFDFGAFLDATASGGVHFVGARNTDEGPELRATIGRGGSRLQLAAHEGNVVIRLVAPAESASPDDRPQVFEKPRPPQ